MNAATIIIGIVVIAVIAGAAFVLIRDHRNGNHCASCRGCSMGACKSKDSGCHCGCEDKEKKE